MTPGHQLPFAANCTFLFTELSLLERPAAAKAAGFDAIEFWWPFDVPTPSDRDVDAFVNAVAEAGVELVGLNFYGGDVAGPDCGVLSIPGRAQDLIDNLDVAVGIGERLGVHMFNALYGNRVAGVAADEQDELGVRSLTRAAEAAARIGAMVLVEAVSGPKPYPLRTADDAVAVVDRARAAGAVNVAVLCDLFHLANNGDDIDKAIAAHVAKVGHVQIADLPGRGEPGSGEVGLDGYLVDLEAGGYDGFVGIEYNPTTTTAESLAWLPRERRSSGLGPSGQGADAAMGARS